MPKLKTRQNVAKRVKITRTGKIIKRKGGQGHFNAHETGNTTRTKRRDITISKVENANLKRALPYS